MAGKSTTFRFAMRPGNRRVLPDTLDGRLIDLLETDKADMRAKVDVSFCVFKQQLGFQKTRLRGVLPRTAARSMCWPH